MEVQSSFNKKNPKFTGEMLDNTTKCKQNEENGDLVEQVNLFDSFCYKQK